MKKLFLLLVAVFVSLQISAQQVRAISDKYTCPGTSNVYWLYETTTIIFTTKTISFSDKTGDFSANIIKRVKQGSRTLFQCYTDDGTYCEIITDTINGESYITLISKSGTLLYHIMGSRILR